MHQPPIKKCFAKANVNACLKRNKRENKRENKRTTKRSNLQHGLHYWHCVPDEAYLLAAI
jgi:hypothetical protein